jgi:hypothetical protein
VAADKPAGQPLMPDKLQPLHIRTPYQFGPELGREEDVLSNSPFWEQSRSRPSIDEVAAKQPDVKLLCRMVYVFGTIMISREENETLRERNLTAWRRFEQFCG